MNFPSAARVSRQAMTIGNRSLFEPLRIIRQYSPPCKGGVDATLRKCREASLMERTGWSLTSYVALSDHPVCGASVAARLFIDAAATPPFARRGMRLLRL